MSNAMIAMSAGTSIPASAVPCAGCTLCCREFTLIPITDADCASDYETQTFAGRTALAWKANGECVYLTAMGCAIHGRAPEACRVYDCREDYHRRVRADPDFMKLPMDHFLRRLMQRGRDLSEAAR